MFLMYAIVNLKCLILQVFYPRTQASRVILSGLSVYIYMCTENIVIERTRDLIYLKLVALDVFPKIISPSAGENSGDSV